jgi:hypothetical protein
LLKLLKKLLLPAAAAVLLALPLAGCAGAAADLPQDPSTFTDQDVRDILAAAVDNVLQASSFAATYTANDAYTGTGDSGLIPSTSTMQITMLNDRDNGRAHITLDISLAAADPDADATPQTLKVDTYLYADYLYINLESMASLPWYKIPVTDTVLDVFSTRLIDNEIAMLDLPASTTYLRNEPYNGADCYVIEVVPNPDELRKNAERQQPQGLEVPWDKLVDITQVYKDAAYTVWIAVDSLQLLKAESRITAEFGGVAAFADDPVLAGITITSHGSVTFSDYNEKTSITLPEEAREAVETSPDNFTQ